jgi:Flp pilus assembly protein CpaB
VTQMELMPYSPEEQAVLDEQHHNKPEINHRHSAGLTVIAYWLRQHNICTIYVQTEDGAAEFVVPNDRVGDYFMHPFSHPDANIGVSNE